MKIYIIIIQFVLSLIFMTGCNSKPVGEILTNEDRPKINPAYSDLSIPVNIAPLNFRVVEKGEAYFVNIKNGEGTELSVSSKDGTITIPEGKWRDLLRESTYGTLTYSVYVKKAGKWTRFKDFINRVESSPIDPFLYYRLLYPSFQKYKDIRIVQRSVESFDEHYIINNDAIDHNCANCHSFNQKNSSNFMIHIRGSMGGTYFLKDGELERFNLKTKEMKRGAVYPRWHPSGKYVAFSSNKVVQHFHAVSEKRIEVVDFASSLLLYDVEKNEIMDIPVDKDENYMDTYPEWSPDGRYLYFCRADTINENKFVYEDIKYNLCRVAFNPESRKFGDAEIVFDAAANGKSMSMPRVSPDGKSLVITYHNYGCFPIWHKEADLYSINLDDFSAKKLNLNSDYTDSYHSWSSNGRWLVFSSKRGDGLTARPYISYIDDSGVSHKPFVLPQKDPEFYSHFVKTFNVPELSVTDVWFTPGELHKATGQEAIQAKWSDNK